MKTCVCDNSQLCFNISVDFIYIPLLKQHILTNVLYNQFDSQGADGFPGSVGVPGEKGKKVMLRTLLRKNE